MPPPLCLPPFIAPLYPRNRRKTMQERCISHPKKCWKLVPKLCQNHAKIMQKIFTACCQNHPKTMPKSADLVVRVRPNAWEGLPSPNPLPTDPKPADSQKPQFLPLFWRNMFFRSSRLGGAPWVHLKWCMFAKPTVFTVVLQNTRFLPWFCKTYGFYRCFCKTHSFYHGFAKPTVLYTF